jgi:hypothetical protein
MLASVERERHAESARRPALRVPVALEGLRATQPATLGVPLPPGLMHEAEGLALRVGDCEIPVQGQALARWADGSVKWLLVDVVADSSLAGATHAELCRASAECRRPAPLRIEELPDVIRVKTGAATFLLDRRVFQPFAQATVKGAKLLETSQTLLTDERGKSRTPRIERIIRETEGPVRSTLLFEGSFAGTPVCRFAARLCFFAGTGLVRMRLTVHNPRRARHKGGLWDLGDPGSMLFRGLALELRLTEAAAQSMQWRAEPGHEWSACKPEALEIYQDSSGGANWQSKNHVNRHGHVPVSFRGYRTRIGGEQRSGLRANPVVGLGGLLGNVAVAVPEFWQQFPKALSIADRTVRVGLFSEQSADLFELQGGEQKTHTVWLHFGREQSAAEQSAAEALAWVHEPAHIFTTPQWNNASGVIDQFTPTPSKLPSLASQESPAFARLESYLAEVMSESSGLLQRREIIDEYGWRNFGEVYADHEGAYYKGSLPLISHYNNQYDVVYGGVLHYLRTGERRWRDVFEPLARHVIDIDIYHTAEDRAAYNSGLFWFTDHYKTAGTCTHRSFTKENCTPGDRSYGGGPGSSHNFTAGLLHYYYLTGNPQAREAVTGLADWVLAMDDGRATVFSIVDDGPTGVASCTADLDYQGPGRGAGNSINALLDAWQLTGKPHYLEAAETLIRRCIHPADDVAARDFLNIELRWSYPMFLTALARYLALKVEHRQIDDMYAYGQASLHHYAAWMVDRERPYFDQAEKMEFPTEVWAAQELRKANVLRLAAAHAEEPLRERLIRRGEELADRGWEDLMRFPSRTVARTAAIVFVEGWRDACLRAYGAKPMPRARTMTFPPPEPFVPQRRRALATLKTARGLAQCLVRLARPSCFVRAWKQLRAR